MWYICVEIGTSNNVYVKTKKNYNIEKDKVWNLRFRCLVDKFLIMVCNNRIEIFLSRSIITKTNIIFSLNYFFPFFFLPLFNLQLVPSSPFSPFASPLVVWLFLKLEYLMIFFWWKNKCFEEKKNCFKFPIWDVK